MSLQVKISAEERLMAYAVSFSHKPEMLLLQRRLPQKEKGMFRGMSVMNVLGYFPLVGTVSGIARIVFALNSKTIENACQSKGQEKAVREAQLVRGGIEVLSVAGPILLIVDTSSTILILSLKR